jgi:hypothetical protein
MTQFNAKSLDSAIRLTPPTCDSSIWGRWQELELEHRTSSRGSVVISGLEIQFAAIWRQPRRFPYILIAVRISAGLGEAPMFASAWSRHCRR